jgi:uncharacterized damage-inducible protein DinB
MENVTSVIPPWFERKFHFDFPVEHHAVLQVRLRGTPARLEELTRHLNVDTLTTRHDGKWSIQENAGHLLDLETLWAARLSDFITRNERLSPADLTNRGTHEASHNSRMLASILEAFRDARMRFVDRLDAQDPAFFHRVALHPRLNQPMRVTDHLYFVAEHDDHHLARIWELRQGWER